MLAVGIVIIKSGSGYEAGLIMNTEATFIEKLGLMLDKIPFAPVIPIVIFILYILINSKTREVLFNSKKFKEQSDVVVNELLEVVSQSSEIDLEYSNDNKMDEKTKYIMEEEAFEAYKNKMRYKQESILEGSISGVDVEIQNSQAYYTVSEGSGNNKKTKTIDIFNGAVHIVNLPVPSSFYMRAVPHNNVHDGKVRVGLNVGGFDLGDVPVFNKKSNRQDRDTTLEQTPSNRLHNYTVQTNDDNIANKIITPELAQYLKQNVAKTIESGLSGGLGGILKDGRGMMDSLRGAYEEIKSSDDMESGVENNLSNACHIEALVVKDGMMYVFFEAPLVVKGGNIDSEDNNVAFDITNYPDMDPDFIWADIENLVERSQIILDIIESLE